VNAKIESLKQELSKIEARAGEIRAEIDRITAVSGPWVVIGVFRRPNNPGHKSVCVLNHAGTAWEYLLPLTHPWLGPVEGDVLDTLPSYPSPGPLREVEPAKARSVIFDVIYGAVLVPLATERGIAPSIAVENADVCKAVYAADKAAIIAALDSQF
jgi:hypothetical protein